jgi:hypothetical protein
MHVLYGRPYRVRLVDAVLMYCAALDCRYIVAMVYADANWHLRHICTQPYRTCCPVPAAAHAPSQTDMQGLQPKTGMLREL